VVDHLEPPCLAGSVAVSLLAEAVGTAVDQRAAHICYALGDGASVRGHDPADSAHAQECRSGVGSGDALRSPRAADPDDPAAGDCSPARGGTDSPDPVPDLPRPRWAGARVRAG